MKVIEVTKFQKQCYESYLKDIQEELPEFPKKYLFPDGNLILPVMPVKTNSNKIMFVGAFPSARFEKRNNILIPVANNLSPFGKEEYFDGQQVRKQASREILDEKYFKILKINPDEHWITDLVKIYLMPDKHIKNCKEINANIEYVNTHKLFKKIAKLSLNWFYKEIEVCNPKLIITFGEVVARTIINDKKTENRKLLNGEIYTQIINGKSYEICHLPHPEIIRRNKEWETLNKHILETLNKFINL